MLSMKTLNPHPFKLVSVMLRRFRPLASPTVMSDANALLFSVKSFMAAMLAYFIALSIGLQQPAWAIVTVYIVSQTAVGSSLSRCLYRFAGTVVGAVATVLIVPVFVNMPVFCSVILTGWIAFCLYLSLQDRTPRAYAFVLAGYTASLIGFPAVSDPGAIFNTAVVRVQEVGIGIFCAAAIHRYVLPIRISTMFNSKLSQILKAVRIQLADTLAGKANKVSDPLHLALALQFLQGVSHHIPYDLALSAPIRSARKEIHDKLVRLLVVNSELCDRALLIKAIPADVQTLLSEVQAWLTCDDHAQRKHAAQTLHRRSKQLMQNLTMQHMTFEEALLVGYMRYLTETIALVQQCDRLSEVIHQMKKRYPLSFKRRMAKGQVLHRDHLTAARMALGAFTIILSGCFIWIYSAWPDGGMAVSILGVCCTLFGSFDTPAPHIVKYMIGCVWGVLSCLLYSFVLLPQVNDFAVLVALLAPTYILAGSLQSRPPTTFMAMGITLTLPILCPFSTHYNGDFAAMLNTSIALFAATGFAVYGMSLLQTIQADSAVNRLMKLCQRDIYRMFKGTLQIDETRWTNLMIDRAALLLPRLQRSELSSESILTHLLHTLRIGLCISYLRANSTPINKEIHDMLTQLVTRNTDTEALRPQVEGLIYRCLAETDESSRQLARRLLDLYCALYKPKMESANDH